MTSAYFTATTNTEELRSNYESIISLLKQSGIQLLSGEQIVNTSYLQKDLLKDKAEIFKRERDAIERADFIIAEVTSPSTGVGGEVVYALTKGKPVLALIYKEAEDKVTPMIAGNPSDNLYFERYDEDNIDLILKNFINHIQLLKKKKGKLIVIDGGDGSGKATQADLLVQYLKSKKIPVKYYDFPRYYTSFHGQTVAKFLRGEFGSLQSISPYLASLAYALDRASVKDEMNAFLNKGGYIIANRYATSNMAHQAAKIEKEEDKREYLKWIYELEYKIHRIPKEDTVFYLYVPWEIGLELTSHKGERKYLKGKKDIQEIDTKHRSESEKMYLRLATENKNWITISCVQNGKLLTPEIIQEEIRKHLTIDK